MRFSNYGFPAVFQKGHNKGMCMGLVSFYPGPPKCSLFSSISYTRGQKSTHPISKILQ